MRVLIATATFVARAIYAVMKAALPVRNKVVFLSRQSDVPSRDFLLLAEALRAADPTLEIVMRNRMLGAGAVARAGAAIAMVGQMYHLATARACVVDGYVIPVSLLDHRPGLFVVQVWHALGAIKKFGYQSLGRPGGRSADIAGAMRMHRNYSLVVCGGPATVPVFAEAFGVDPAIVAPIGLPRMDYLRAAARDRSDGILSEGAARLLEAFPILADSSRRVILYAPTFRTASPGRYREVAARFAGPRYTLIVKPHPLESALANGDNVVNAGGADILDVLPLCSAVVTDYSAVAFEAALMDLPVYFWVYDHDEYSRDCGLNVDPLIELAEVSSIELDEVAGMIGSDRTAPQAMERFKERYVSAPAGCAERIVGRILGSEPRE